MKEITLGEWKIKNKTYTNKNARIYEKIKYREYKIDDLTKITETIILNRFTKEINKNKITSLNKDNTAKNYNIISINKNGAIITWIEGQKRYNEYGKLVDDFSCVQDNYGEKVLWNSNNRVINRFNKILNDKYNLYLDFDARRK